MARVSVKVASPLLAAAKPSRPKAEGYKPPSHEEMLVESAHRAHRDVVEGWVKGEKSERQVKQSKTRLGKVLKEHT